MPSANNNKPANWLDALAVLSHRRVLTMLFFGFSAGIPLLLIFSSLSLWLGEAGIATETVTYFSWAALGYSFKFVWAPIIDKVPVPVLSRVLGRRRAWLLISQIAIASAIILMGSVDPAKGESALSFMALSAVLLGFSAATQDIVIDAFRIESAETRLQAMMNSAYVAGYRIGMVVSGAGALFIAAWLGSEMGQYNYEAWRWTYYAMSSTMIVGLLTTLLVSEPEINNQRKFSYTGYDYIRLVIVFVCSTTMFVMAFYFTSDSVTSAKVYFDSVFVNFLIEAVRLIMALLAGVLTGVVLVRFHVVNQQMAKETWYAPVADFFSRYGLSTAFYILALIGLYRIADIIPGTISNLFYQHLGFTKPEIATAVKTFGVIVSIVGGLLGGVVANYLGVMRTLFIGALLAAFTNLVFVWLAHAGNDIVVMYVAVIIDNLAGGFAIVAFVAFLSSLTSISFTAMQYAMFSSLMTLIPKTLGGYSGSIVASIGYPWFFTLVVLIGIPVLWLVWKVNRLLLQQQG